MKETKRRMEFFSLYDHTNIEKHLEKMALKGWLIEEIGSYFWKYKKIEPKKLRFSVAYYPKRVNEGTIVSADRQHFIDMCSSGGWKYVINKEQMHIFCTKDESTPPIETDPEIQIECIHKFAKREIINNNLVIIACCIFLIAFWGYQMWKEPVDIITDEFFRVWFTPFFIVFSIYNIFSYLLWHKKAKAAAENGEFTETKRILNINFLFWLPIYWFSATVKLFTFLRFRYLLFALGLLVALILFFRLFGTIRKAIDKTNYRYNVKTVLKILAAVVLIIVYSGASSCVFNLIPMPYNEILIETDNKTKTYNIYHDEGAPVDISDFIDISNKTVSHEKNINESLFIRQTEWTVFSVNENAYNEINYTITDIRFTPILERCKNELIYNHYIFDYKKLDIDSEYVIYKSSLESKSWNNQYVFSDGNRIVEVRFSWLPAPEEIKYTAEKLLNADT